MTRGNQREEARAKNQKKGEAKGVRKDDMTHAQRKEHDAKVLREKQAAKAALKAAAEAGGGAAAANSTAAKKK
ncbi:hypothetical protein HDU86_008514 [Geranomyces michiganensis]|nr:hypothetical protein HDU86_008514 [Geranomyces michiganensis]